MIRIDPEIVTCPMVIATAGQDTNAAGETSRSTGRVERLIVVLRGSGVDQYRLPP